MPLRPPPPRCTPRPPPAALTAALSSFWALAPSRQCAAHPRLRQRSCGALRHAPTPAAHHCPLSGPQRSSPPPLDTLPPPHAGQGGASCRASTFGMWRPPSAPTRRRSTAASPVISTPSTPGSACWARAALGWSGAGAGGGRQRRVASAARARAPAPASRAVLRTPIHAHTRTHTQGGCGEGQRARVCVQERAQGAGHTKPRARQAGRPVECEAWGGRAGGGGGRVGGGAAGAGRCKAVRGSGWRALGRRGAGMCVCVETGGERDQRRSPTPIPTCAHPRSR